jgi:GTPase SAR1 family protein
MLKVSFIVSKVNLIVAIKVLVVGNGGVGKSSLIKRFAKGIFTDQYKQTYLYLI